MKGMNKYWMYPTNQRTGEPDLNVWYALFPRRMLRALRRGFWRLRPKKRSALVWELARLCAPDEMTEAARKCANEIHRTLGTDSIYRYTPKQQVHLRDVSRALFDEMLAERKKKNDERGL